MPVAFDPSHWEQTWTARRGVQRDIRGAILAAGMGSRMAPLTSHHLPKPMFPLGGRVPMSELWVRRLVASGITDISMNLCVLSETLRRHFADGSRWGAGLRLVDEAEPTGTLGGVCKQVLGRQARPVLPGEQPPDAEPFTGSTVVAVSGDIVANFGPDQLEELYDIHKKVGAAFTMVLAPIPWDRRKDFGTAILDRPVKRLGQLSTSGRITRFMEKVADSPSNLNNASIYLVEAELLRTLDAQRTPAEVEMTDPCYDFGKQVFPALLGQAPHIKLPGDHLLWGVQFDGGWYDVGNKRDYLLVNEALLDGKVELDLPYQRHAWGYLGSDVELDFSRVTIRPPVIIGDGCAVRPGATLGPYAVLGDGWTVGSGAEISHSVLWPRYPYFTAEGRQIPPQERLLLDRHEVGPGVRLRRCLVVGGELAEDLEEKVVDLDEDGRQVVLPLDYKPDGPRA